jgi:diacylglycerol kinase family enzyme
VDWHAATAVAAVVFAAAALAVAVAAWRRGRRAAPEPLAPAADHPRPGKQLALVVNPSKPGAAAVVETVLQMCGDVGWPPPLVLQTTVDEPGGPQAERAVAAGADIVVAAGGDGTVRSVAGALTGGNVPMGIIPGGTGNLLARNLDLPLTSAADALAVVIGGRDRRIDVGWARVVETERGLDGTPRAGAAVVGDTQMFLVIAGIGFDAAMVVDTDDTLKRRMGWIAYFVAGMRHLHERRLKVTVKADNRPEVTTRLRSILVGNCGRLPGGVVLLPDARIDDGILDVAGIDTRGGIVGWAQLLGEIILQGTRVQNRSPWKIGRIGHARARRVRIRVDGPARRITVTY